MVKKEQVIMLLTAAILLPSCGQQSHSESISSYWETIQNEPSPYGYYRMKDGWYQGVAVSDKFSYDASNPSKPGVYKHLEERIVAQIEWVDKKEAMEFSESRGYVTSLSATYSYQETSVGSNDTSISGAYSIVMKNHQYFAEETLTGYPSNGGESISKSRYGSCVELEFVPQWEEYYLSEFEGAAYFFNQDEKVLQIKDISKSLNRHWQGSGTFCFDCEGLDAVTRLEETGLAFSKSYIEESNELFISCSKLTRRLDFLDSPPQFDVPQEGQEMKDYTFPWLIFPSTIFPQF